LYGAGQSSEVAACSVSFETFRSNEVARFGTHLRAESVSSNMVSLRNVVEAGVQFWAATLDRYREASASYLSGYSQLLTNLAGSMRGIGRAYSDVANTTITAYEETLDLAAEGEQQRLGHEVVLLESEMAGRAIGSSAIQDAAKSALRIQESEGRMALAGAKQIERMNTGGTGLIGLAARGHLATSKFRIEMLSARAAQESSINRAGCEFHLDAFDEWASFMNVINGAPSVTPGPGIAQQAIGVGVEVLSLVTGIAGLF